MKRILITPGEPAGIGPDVLIKALQQSWPCELIAVADPDLLTTRAHELNLPFSYQLTDLKHAASCNQPGSIKIYPVTLATPSNAQTLDVKNAPYVIETLRIATDYCLTDTNAALVTGPVHKAIINQAGIPFTGHTEWLAHATHVTRTVMLFVVDQLKVALATTHLPLNDVPAAITQENLRTVLSIMQKALITQFGIKNPRIGICGLNPHAGENGYLGREEIDIMMPIIQALRKTGMTLSDPLPADTLFTPEKINTFDMILAMYHDQALPIVKYLGFDRAVNVTLGLPFIRTSVDHGTALDIAGTGLANAGSLIHAITLAAKMTGDNST